MSEEIIRRYGWLKQPKDSRDYIYKAPALVPGALLPTSVDLRQNDSPIQDQLSLGSCTAQATCGALQFLEIKERTPCFFLFYWIKKLGLLLWKCIVRVFLNKSYEYGGNLSRLFVYYNARYMIGMVEIDSGAYIRDAIKSVVNQGVGPETEWPYNVTKFAVRAPIEVYQHAFKHLVTEYRAINNTSLADMKGCLASGYPFIFGFCIYSSFFTSPLRTTGIVKMPDVSKEEFVGGHAVCCVGYDDNKQCFLIRNSWGTGFGLKGYFWLPYAYINDPYLADDFWTMTKAKDL